MINVTFPYIDYSTESDQYWIPSPFSLDITILKNVLLFWWLQQTKMNS